MSQTGYSKVQIYSSSTATNTPSASNLTNDTNGSELAINITDGKLFYKDNGGTVQVIASKASNIGNFSSDITVHGLTVGLGGGSATYSAVVGLGAMAATNTGDNNNAFGASALAAVTSGTRNSAFGRASLSATVSGNDNSAYGHASLQSNTGSSNTAFGSSALSSNTTAGNNTAVGYQAGYAQTTGGVNTYLGNQAGNNITTGYYNLYLGAGTTASSASVTYENVIGYGATGKGALTTFVASAGGSYQSNNSAAWSITSDSRIKENVVTLADGLTPILSLRPVTFDYIVSKKSDVSFIAQEYQTIFPEQVNTHAASPEEKEVAGTDTLFGLNKNLDPYLVRAVQQLNALIQAQATEIAALKAKVGA